MIYCSCVDDIVTTVHIIIIVFVYNRITWGAWFGTLWIVVVVVVVVRKWFLQLVMIVDKFCSKARRRKTCKAAKRLSQSRRASWSA